MLTRRNGIGRNRIALFCSLIGIVLFACSTEPGNETEYSFEVVDSAGVTIVKNQGVVDAGADLLKIREDLRIGSLEGDEEELLFHNILAVLLDDRGRIFVGNDQTGTVRLFDRDGTFIREFGGKGQGPGELPAMLNDLKWAGEEIALIDWQMGGKTVLYDTTGEFSRSFRNTQPNGRRISLAGYTPNGWVGSESTGSRPESPVPGQAYSQPTTMRRVAPTLDSLEEELFELPGRVRYGSRSTGGLDWPLFEAPSGTGFDGRGNYYRIVPGQYRIDVRNPIGSLVRSVRRGYRPIPISHQDILEYKELVRLQYDTLSRIPEAYRKEQLSQYLARIAEQETFPIPATRHPLKSILVARDGAFWVERLDVWEPAVWWQDRMSGGFGKTPTVETDWDLFSSEGRFLGRAKLPPRFMPMAVTSNSVVGVLKDEFDVEYVVRFVVAAEW